MSAPIAEVIAIGDEMTSGARLDTNTQWICRRLGELGIQVRFTSMVGDQLDNNIAVFRQAGQRADFIVATGGLGPTADDLTRDAIAAAFDLPLELMPAALAQIESMFARSGKPMPPRNQVQAMFPQGAAMIPNLHGTAPGVDLVLPPRNHPVESAAAGYPLPPRLFALPGVPAEMFEMFQNTVTPRLLQQLGGGRRVLQYAVLKCFGIGESAMEARLGEMISRQHYPLVGITVNAATISLRIVAESDSELECQRMIAQTRAEIIDLAGEYVYGEGESFELQDAVGGLLHARGERMAAIEFGAAAWVTAAMADVAPSTVWAGGLNLPASNRPPHDWAALVAGFTGSAAAADWLLVVDRYPSLQAVDDDKTDSPPGDVHFTFQRLSSGQRWQMQQRFVGHPDILHARIGKTALAFARQCLADQADGTNATTD